MYDIFVAQAIADTIATVAPIVPSVPVAPIDPEVVTHAPEWISMILNVILGLLGLIGFGGIWIASRIEAVKKEMSELFAAVIVSLGDGKISPEEVDSIIKEAKDVYRSVKEQKK